MRWRALACVLALGFGGCQRDDTYHVSVDLVPWITALSDDDRHDEAVEFLARLLPAALPALQLALQKEPEPVRLGVIEALAQEHERPEVLAALQGASTNDNAEVRYAAFEALLDSSQDETPRFERALNDPDAKVRLVGARGFETHCGSPAALERLSEIALRDEPFPNAVWAKFVLGRMAKGTDTCAPLARTTVDRLSTAVTLEQPLPARARAALLRLALDLPVSDHVALRQAAVTPESGPLLRVHATYALGSIADATDVPTFATLLAEPFLQRWAADALMRLSANQVSEATRVLAAYQGPRPEISPMPPPNP